ncbi:heterokaryon incompatibility protein-domain-containing protein, partial [Phaeosphaeriaceae sp. PMI808]
MTDGQTRCKYRPLHKLKQIRLLYLQPRSKGEEIHCVLKHITLKKRFLRGIPKYSALSYTWGSPSDKKNIRCNYSGQENTVVEIPTNLYHALKRFRHEEFKSRVLWADAICINQEDIQERAVQVRFMRQIFANAVDVPIWLGEHTETSR